MEALEKLNKALAPLKERDRTDTEVPAELAIVNYTKVCDFCNNVAKIANRFRTVSINLDRILDEIGEARKIFRNKKDSFYWFETMLDSAEEDSRIAWEYFKVVESLCKVFIVPELQKDRASNVFLDSGVSRAQVSEATFRIRYLEADYAALIQDIENLADSISIIRD